MEKEYRALALLKAGDSDYEYLEDVTIRLPVDGTVAQLHSWKTASKKIWRRRGRNSYDLTMS